MHALKRVLFYFHFLAFSWGQVKMIQILFEKKWRKIISGFKDIWIRVDRTNKHIKMSCHEHHNASCITLKPKHIHLQESLFPFVYFFIMYSVHGLVVEFYIKLNFHTMLTEHFVFGCLTCLLRACLHGGGGPQPTVGHPTYHVNVITLKINERLYGQVGYPT